MMLSCRPVCNVSGGIDCGMRRGRGRGGVATGATSSRGGRKPANIGSGGHWVGLGGFRRDPNGFEGCFRVFWMWTWAGRFLRVLMPISSLFYISLILDLRPEISVLVDWIIGLSFILPWLLPSSSCLQKIYFSLFYSIFCNCRNNCCCPNLDLRHFAKHNNNNNISSSSSYTWRSRRRRNRPISE